MSEGVFGLQISFSRLEPSRHPNLKSWNDRRASLEDLVPDALATQDGCTLRSISSHYTRPVEPFELDNEMLHSVEDFSLSVQTRDM